MAAAATIDKTYNRNDTTQATQIARGSITLSGSYATHGDTLDLSQLFGVQSRKAPVEVRVFEAPAAGTSPSGYVYIFCPGTDGTNGKLTIFTTGTAAGDPLNELAAGAYPAGLTGATIKFVAFFPVGI